MEQEYRTNMFLQKVQRPQSAQISNEYDSRAAAFIQTGSTSGHFRPWTAHPKVRSEVSPRKIPRQHLSKSHMKVPGRSKEAGIDSVSTLNHQSHENLHEQARETSWPQPSQEQSVSQGTRHLSFENWVEGSPHDSDEYDTDVEEEKKPVSKKSTLLSDPTGIITYEEQCQKHGCVPISYLQRHLNKRNIRMRHHYLGGLSTKPVAAALKRNTVTEHVDLADNCVEAAGAYYLADMLKENMFIVCLNLANNFIGSTGAAAFAGMLEVNTTLKTLSLAGNQLQDRDACKFIDALKNNLSLTCLDLSHNEFGEKGGEIIGSALNANDSLTDVDLSWNAIRNKGAVAIAKALKTNATLEVLDLSWNGFGSPGAESLQQALQVNTTLKALDLTNNRINSQAALKLALGLKKNFGLETLVLNLNPLGDSGVEAILKAVATHESLKFLSMENCGELSINASNFRTIHQLEEAKNIIILHGGVGGYHRHTVLSSVLKLFVLFSHEHHGHLENAFYQQDKDKSGVLTTDEMKFCLKEAGLRLTSHQVDLLIREIDYTHTGNIKYRDILSGKCFSDYHKQRPSRGFTLTAKGDSSMKLSSFGRPATVS
ncbi:LOW QUALITY PROTEIN: leucine-rich repeat-containing protein 74A-like [Haliotis rubra]|uniref:LOW QUALITY PROTEIN: leucine-rich repeat-containing protein 74A-like n=1 Tax=Haliotis rubra TaxID=36100 RepID=UPI001EE4F7AC|nr:LOW QUALITY PROTEIN: leucine-rich repeat-containing protein 74A-like [Haliotis rubra]